LEIVKQYQADKAQKAIELVDHIPGAVYMVNPADCWCFFIPSDDSHIGAGRYICISKATGEIVFDGMAGE
jgi:hypothetical protein